MLDSIKVNLKLPYIGSIEGVWKPNRSERQAAWDMYVELATRVTVVHLGPDEGMLREALNSLHSLFSTTREVLKKYGPSVAQVSKKNGVSFAFLAVSILNLRLRPVLAKWHPMLLDYEGKRPQGVSPAEHERAWDKNVELRGILAEVRESLVAYANILAKVAMVPALIGDIPQSNRKA